MESLGTKSGQFQTFDAAFTGRKLVCFMTETLEHTHKDLRGGSVVRLVERKMTRVLEAAAEEKQRHILRVMAGGVPEVAAVENHRTDPEGSRRIRR